MLYFIICHIICVFRYFDVTLHANNKFLMFMAEEKKRMQHTKLRIKELMKERGITSIEAANQLGLMKNTISYIINGINNPSVPVLEQFADLLGVTIGELFDDYKQDESSALVCPHCGKPIHVTLS